MQETESDIMNNLIEFNSANWTMELIIMFNSSFPFHYFRWIISFFAHFFSFPLSRTVRSLSTPNNRNLSLQNHGKWRLLGHIQEKERSKCRHQEGTQATPPREAPPIPWLRPLSRHPCHPRWRSPSIRWTSTRWDSSSWLRPLSKLRPLLQDTITAVNEAFLMYMQPSFTDCPKANSEQIVRWRERGSIDNDSLSAKTMPPIRLLSPLCACSLLWMDTGTERM